VTVYDATSKTSRSVQHLEISNFHSHATKTTSTFK
jgi:hypothetical protein